MNALYETLKKALRNEIQANDLKGKNIQVTCKALSASEAIGQPAHDDYPIIKGKETIVEAVFEGAKGQAFADEYENADFPVEALLNVTLDSNSKRALFISGLNAVFRYLDLCEKTVHCKDNEPIECANQLPEMIRSHRNVLLIGHQPRFLEILSSRGNVRVVDLDADNIGKTVCGIAIESQGMTSDAIGWCDLIFATGSTVVNGTITDFLELDKPAIFYGVTISAAAKILGLNAYCHCGH